VGRTHACGNQFTGQLKLGRYPIQKYGFLYGLMPRWVMTVAQFEWDDNKDAENQAKHHVSFESLGQAIGAKERLCMKKKIVYTDEPMGDVQVVADFLPSPAELAFREDGVKVTLALSKSSVDFFKSEAAKHQTQYQRMIRRLLDSYVEAQGAAASMPKRTGRKRAPI
jgi:predicted DNA binding CopG/RHH family protein